MPSVRDRCATQCRTQFREPDGADHTATFSFGKPTLGHHLLLDLYDCDVGVLDDVDAIREVMCDAADAMGAHILGKTFHRFQPQGVSGVLLLGESHLSVHTWPESAYAAADAYTCGDVDPSQTISPFRDSLRASSLTVTRLLRGRFVDLRAQAPGTWLHVTDLPGETQ